MSFRTARTRVLAPVMIAAMKGVLAVSSAPAMPPGQERPHVRPLEEYPVIDWGTEFGLHVL